MELEDSSKSDDEDYVISFEMLYRESSDKQDTTKNLEAVPTARFQAQRFSDDGASSAMENRPSNRGSTEDLSFASVANAIDEAGPTSSLAQGFHGAKGIALIGLPSRERKKEVPEASAAQRFSDGASSGMKNRPSNRDSKEDLSFVSVANPIDEAAPTSSLAQGLPRAKGTALLGMPSCDRKKEVPEASADQGRPKAGKSHGRKKEVPEASAKALPPPQHRARHEPWQIDILEAEFKLFSYPTPLRILTIADAIGDTASRVDKWFQTRRGKDNKEFKAVASQMEPLELKKTLKKCKREKKKKKKKLLIYAESRGTQVQFSSALTEFLKKRRESEAQESKDEEN